MNKPFLTGLIVGCSFATVASILIVRQEKEGNTPVVLGPQRTDAEMDSFTFGRAFAADFTLTSLSRGDVEEAIRVSQMHIDNFIDHYEAGMDIRHLSGRAEEVYLRHATKNQTEPGEVVNASSAAGMPENHLHD